MNKYLFIILSLITFSSLNAQNKTNEIPFRLTKYNNILIPVVINQQDTVQLMLHTGSDYVTLIEKSFNNLNSITVNDTIHNVKSWAGYADLKVSDENLITLGNENISQIPIYVDQQSGHESDGKIGLKFFEGKYLEINFDENKLKVHAKAPKHLKKYIPLDSKYINQTLFIEAYPKIKSEVLPTEFMLHTGFSGAIVFADEFVQKNNLLTIYQATGESKMSDAAGNAIISKKSILPHLKFGNVDFKDVPMTYFDSKITIQNRNIIGGDLIKRFNIIISPDKKIVYLKKNKNYKDSYFTI